MAEIIHVPHGETPDLEPTCGVYEWMPGGKYSVRQMPGFGSWYYVPDDMFDGLIIDAGERADGLGHQRVYIIGRPG